MEMRAVYAECLAELMTRDRHVCVLDADLAKASGTRALYERFPNQMFDCGVAEQNMASIAAGLASYGFKPYIESFTRSPPHLRPDSDIHILREEQRQNSRH